MTKLLIILLIGLVCESAGVVLLKKGMTNLGEIEIKSAAGLLQMLKAGVTNPQILLGVLFEALFFGCLLLLMSKSDISFLWPLTALSFVFATLAAKWFLGEQVSPVRWAGVAFIMIGAGLISYSEHAKPNPPAVAAQTASEKP
jgi:drug/metabolite transporter (DMT)-like permease